MDATANASLDLSPRGNQVVITILIILACAFLGGGVWLQILGKSWWLPVLIGAILFIVASVFWWKSHKNESLKIAHAFHLKVGEGETSVAVTSDARSLPALDYLKDIIGHYAAVFHREPLPAASGKVDAQGRPIDGTENAARDAVDAANRIAQEQSNAVADEICANIRSTPPSSPVLGDVELIEAGEPVDS